LHKPLTEWRKKSIEKSDNEEKIAMTTSDSTTKSAMDDLTIPFTKVALTTLFACSVFAFCVELVRFNYFLSSYNGYITALTDKVLENANDTEKGIAVSSYTNYLGSIQLLEAMIFGPIVGFVVDGSQYLLRRANPQFCDEEGDKIIRLKANVYSIAIASTLGVLSCILQCIPSMKLQILTTFVVCQYRAFLMGSTANFLNLAFPAYHFGKVKLHHAILAPRNIF